MNTNEIRVLFKPHLVVTQSEYVDFMRRVDEAQTAANHPYADKTAQLHIERTRLAARINAIKVEIAAVDNDIRQLNLDRKEMNRAFHNIKHEMAQLNPKDTLPPE
jgi:predicted  nucleic acid-binding Zn-ribbon protein